MTYRRKLADLQSSIQILIKTGTNTKELADLQELLPLLKKAIQTEDKALEVVTDAQINSGYQTQLTTEATIDPKYKDIKEIEQFLYEDNIRDTNPILILSFNKLIGLTIDYLQNLEGMLKVISANSHEDDRISDSIKQAILDLFTGNDVNSYELNEHIRTVLGQIIDNIFNGQGSVFLTNFCDGLAFEIRDKLIKSFQTTAKKQLKKEFGKKFRKHKKSPYPSISKILTAIDLYDIPFNVQGKADKERLIKNLALWYSDFLQRLLKFEAEHQTDFLNDSLLQKGLKGFGNSLVDKVTPPSCKLHLVDNIVNKLGSTPILKSGDLVSSIKVELDALRLKIKTSIESESFEGSDDIEHFLGIQAENYFDFIRTSLEKNRFDEYKKIIKDWVISLDKLMNKLGIDQERGKYNYKSKIIALNLSKLFNIEHDLIDLSSFIKKIIDSIKATGFSLELSEVDSLFSAAISEGTIYTKLIDLYNTTIEKGTFDSSLDTLETTLPTMTQIAHAILRAKIDLILNREVKDLTFNYNFAWADRTKIITKLIDTIINEADIAALCERFIAIIENSNDDDDEDNGDTPPPITSDSWLEWAKGILQSIRELPQRLADVLIQSIRDYYTGVLSSIAAVVTQVRNFLERQLEDDGALNIPDVISNTNSEIYFPLSLYLDEDKNGNFLPYLTLKSGTTHTDVWSILVDGNYYKLEATTLSSNIGNVNGYTISNELTIKIRFTDPGYSISSGVSALFISADVSTVKDEYDEDIELVFNFDSTYNKGKNQVEISNITFNNINTIILQEDSVTGNNLVNINLSTSVLTKGRDAKIKAFI